MKATKAILLTFLFIFIFGTVNLNAEETTLRVKGYGTTRAAALEDAKRNAVEEGLGVIIASETLVRNSVLASDKIYSKAGGFVKNYREIDAEREADGNYVVTIEAEVTEILDEILKDEIALGLLLEWLEKPRFMVIIDENLLGDESSIIAESEIGKILKSKNFNLVSSSQVDKIRARAGTLADLEGNVEEAVAIGTEFGAEIYVQGKATVSAVELKGAMYAKMGLEGMYSGQSSITASVIRTDTGDILAVNTFTGKSTHISKETAAVNSILESSGKLANYLVKETVRTWSQEQSNVRTFKLRISNVNFKRRKKIENYLSNLGGVEGVSRISFGSGNAVLSIEYTGGVLDDLAKQLDGGDLGDFVMEVTGDSPGTLSLNVILK